MSLVSIIAPCYNGDKYLDRFFLSLLNQDFKDFEIFFIDDGSTDNTKNVAMKFVEDFKKINITLNYIFKENGGAASAINVAFNQNLSGKYLFILDSDDELPSNSISEKVKFMETHRDYGACTGYYKFIDNDSLKTLKIDKSRGISNNKHKTTKNIILAKNIAFPGYFFNKDKLFSVLKNNKIFESKQGQNWQLLIPISYNFRIGIIPKVLYNYYVIKSSHSHSIKNTIDEQIKRVEGLHKIQINTLDSIKAKEIYYLYAKKFKYNHLISIAYKLGNKNLMKESVKQYKKNVGCLSLKNIIKFLFVMLGLKNTSGKERENN